MVPWANTEITRLQDRLKDPAVFEKAISPMQFSAIMAQLFCAMALTVGAFFLLPALWHLLKGTLQASENYNIRFNAMMGGGMAAFLALLALLCWSIAKLHSKPLLRKLHQAYLRNPAVCQMTAILRRGNIILNAYAATPPQQHTIEHLLRQTLQTSPEAYQAAYKRIARAHVKHKASKANALKKQLVQTNPALQPYDFHLNWFEHVPQAGEHTYYLFMPTELLPIQGNYVYIHTQAIQTEVIPPI